MAGDGSTHFRPEIWTAVGPERNAQLGCRAGSWLLQLRYFSVAKEYYGLDARSGFCRCRLRDARDQAKPPPAVAVSRVHSAIYARLPASFAPPIFMGFL